MKNHLLSLFDPAYRWFTISFFIASATLIIASQVVGITDNLPGIAMLLTGMVMLFFAFLHPWRKPERYALLAGICLGLIVLTFLVIYLFTFLKLTRFLSEAVVMGFIGLVCLPGILAGISGLIFWAAKQK